MKKKIISALLLAALYAGYTGNADAQQSVVVPIATAKLSWSWTQGAAPNDGIPTQFNVNCNTGTTLGTPTKITVVPYPTMNALVKDIITGPGTWTCAVTAQNTIGTSPASAPITFVAGSLPVAPTNPVISSQ